MNAMDVKAADNSPACDRPDSRNQYGIIRGASYYGGNSYAE